MDGVVAGALAWAPSGLPSTIHALTTGRDLLEPVRAAGTLLVPSGSSAPALLASGAAAHTGLSLGWALLLAFALPERLTVAAGVAAGLLIAGLDLGVVGRRYPAIGALPTAPQVGDHLVFAAGVALVVRRRRRRRRPTVIDQWGG
ncbi:MAG: hypothetical protein M3N11_02210 [Actinomycetota bacterium]|nr:hypothetical protein [Actinomycetota bacterium]